MGRSVNRGFTIIETVLFLSITSVLIVALLAGVTVSINAQRYQDSVDSFKSLLQNQYSDLTNVYNDRQDTWTCSNGAVTSEGGSSADVRGQSDCVVMGRYIYIQNGDISLADVVGYESSSDQQTDLDVIRDDYELGLSSVHEDERQLEWGTRISWPVAGTDAETIGTPRSLALLIIQSPVTQTVYTFTSDSPPDSIDDVASDDLKAMVIAGESVPGQASRVICIESDGLSVTGNTSVFISAYATNASSIETRSNDFYTELGEATRC
jgi:type II secretory pathway pseudopilin PulG